MKQLPHLSALLYATPWAILPAVHGELGQLYRAYLAGNITGPRADMKDDDEKDCGGIRYTVDRGARLAVIEVHGVITKANPRIMCGPPVVALAELDEVIADAAADAGIDTVVFRFSSPGGSTVGLVETAAAIQDLAEEKRVVAYTDSEMCSAAYWLACACDEIYSAPSAIVGSIGTYLAAVDDSRMWEMEGLELKLFRVGTLKGVGLSGKKWTEEEEKWLTGLTDKCGADFRAWVTARRPGVPAEAMEGQFFFAADAPAGLIDGLHRDLSSLLAVLMDGPADLEDQ